MFSSGSKKEQNKTTVQNIKIEDVFQSLEARDEDKIREYFSDPESKVWQLKDDNGYTILHKAVFNGDIVMTNVILEELRKRLGMRSKDSMAKFIDEKNNEGLTALHYAAYKGNITILKRLVESGASVDAVTNLGKNVMHMAAEGNQPSMMIYLITQEHQSTQIVDENGSTPLHWACYAGAEDSVNFLLNLSADINAQDKENLTPLHLAVLGGKDKIVIKLLQKNADKNIPNKKGETPYDLAVKKNFGVIMDLLGEDEDYNPLCTLDTPKSYIAPSDVYKKFIILMIVIPEVVNYLFILPYLDGYIETYVSLPAFILSLISYFIFIMRNPGYKKNDQLESESQGKYPLFNKINEGVDVRNFCPKCFIKRTPSIKHCFICDKCVENFSHHCFWINKCIGKKNRIFYFIFVLLSLIYANHSMFICLELLWDDVNLPYEQKYFHLYLFSKKKGFRVLGAATVGLFCLCVGLALWFLFLNELLKYFGINKKKIDENDVLIKENDKLDILELRDKTDEDDDIDNGEKLIINNEDGNASPFVISRIIDESEDSEI